jgi:hypothetical protein
MRRRCPPARASGGAVSYRDVVIRPLAKDGASTEAGEDHIVAGEMQSAQMKLEDWTKKGRLHVLYAFTKGSWIGS